jgi:hypothetical protein
MTFLDIAASAAGSVALIPLLKAAKAYIRKHLSVDVDVRIRASWPKPLQPADEIKAK